MASFVFGHLMNRVMDSVEVQLLSQRSQFFLASASTMLGVDAHGKVLLRAVGQDFAEELSEFCSMLSFFERIALEGFGDLGIAFPFGLAAHRQVHAHFGAFAPEIVPEPFEDFGVFDLPVADVVLAGPLRGAFFFRDFNEFARGNMALGASFGRVFAFIDETADEASEFLFHKLILSIVCRFPIL